GDVHLVVQVDDVVQHLAEHHHRLVATVTHEHLVELLLNTDQRGGLVDVRARVGQVLLELDDRLTRPFASDAFDRTALEHPAGVGPCTGGAAARSLTAAGVAHLRPGASNSRLSLDQYNNPTVQTG